MDYRAILFHKQATSARLRFLMFAHGSVCAIAAIPALAQVHEGEALNPVVHPAPVLRELEREYGFPVDSLRVEEEYRNVVEVPHGKLQIMLVAIESVDPPFSLAESIGARFIELTQARGLPPVELELLRGAYELVLGG